MMDEKPEIWGAKLPPRGERVARLLNQISNVTLPLKQRMEDAKTLAELTALNPHGAWRLACDARLALGFGPSGSACWRQIATKQPPGGVWPTAEQWLAAADLDCDGCSRDQQARAAWPTDAEAFGVRA